MWASLIKIDWERARGSTCNDWRGGLVFGAHKLWYHSTLGLRVIKPRRRKIGGHRVNRPIAALVPILSEKGIKLKTSVKKVYYTACSLPVI